LVGNAYGGTYHDGETDETNVGAGGQLEFIARFSEIVGSPSEAGPWARLTG
jgi:hypothetical protein